MLPLYLFIVLIVTVLPVLIITLRGPNDEFVNRFFNSVHEKDEQQGEQKQINTNTLDLQLHVHELSLRLQSLMNQLELEHIVLFGPSKTHAKYFLVAQQAGLNVHYHKDLNHYQGPTQHVLFFIERQPIHGSIPEDETCFYLLWQPHQQTLLLPNVPDDRKCYVNWFSTSCIPNTTPLFDDYTRISTNSRCLYMPRATHLLPHEFPDLVDLQLQLPFVTITTTPIKDFMQHVQGMQVFVVKEEEEEEEAYLMNSIRTSQCAPVLLSSPQKESGDIPKEILQNISFGHLAVTTSVEADYMLHYNTIAHKDEKELAYKYDSITRSSDYEFNWQHKQAKAYRLVQERHTYFNRLEFLLTGLNLYNVNNNNNNNNHHDKIHILHVSCNNSLPAQEYLDFVFTEQLNYQIDHLNVNQHEDSDTIWQFEKYSHVIVTADYDQTFLSHWTDQTKLIMYKWHNNNNDNNNKQVRIISNSKWNRVQAIQNNVFWSGPFADTVIRPWMNEYETNVILSESSPHVYMAPTQKQYFQDLDTHNISYVTHDDSTTTTVSCKAIVHIPKTACSDHLFRHGSHGIVTYIPSKTFLKDIRHHEDDDGEDDLFYAEWYDPKLEPCFVYFNSWAQLSELLQNTEHYLNKTRALQMWMSKEIENNATLWSILLSRWW